MQATDAVAERAIVEAHAAEIAAAETAAMKTAEAAAAEITTMKTAAATSGKRLPGNSDTISAAEYETAIRRSDASSRVRCSTYVQQRRLASSETRIGKPRSLKDHRRHRAGAPHGGVGGGDGGRGKQGHTALLLPQEARSGS